MLAGYRYLRYADGVAVTENLVSTNPNNPNNVPQGAAIGVGDTFRAHNDFNGFDGGLEAQVLTGRLKLTALAKLAVGYNHQAADINGSTTVTVAGSPPATAAGGLLALPSNIGHSSRDEISLIPELGVKMSYRVRPGIRLTGGYGLLYWTNVARSGRQIDPVVDTTQLPFSGATAAGLGRPAVTFPRSDLWVQGLTMGLEFRY